MGKLINRIPGSRLLISSLPDSALITFVESLVGGFSTNRLLDVWETPLSFSKYLLSKTCSQNIKYCSVAFSLLFSKRVSRPTP